MSASPLEITAQLREASPASLRAWVNAHAEPIALHAKRALIATAGRELGKRDVGPKIGGARKDQAALLAVARLLELEAMGPGIAYKAVSKQGVLGEFDVHAARAAGDSAGCAFLKRALFGLVSTRPADSPVARSNYVKGCAYLRENLPACHTVESVFWFLRLWSHLAVRHYREGARLAELITDAEFEQRFPRGRWEEGVRVGPKEDQYQLVNRAGFAYWDRTQDNRVGLFVSISKDETADYKARAESMGDRFASAVRGRGKGRDAQTPAFYSETRQKALIFERADDWSWSEAGEAPEGQPRKRNEFVFVRAGLTGVRKGGPTLGPVTGKLLVDTFGLRALEHGNWMGDSGADTGEAAAFGAFTDLALVLGVQPDMMGFRGRLGLALGARGSGKAAAHYEPSYRVINLTKTAGAGTLAHEWGHALDHWLADPTGRSGMGVYCSGGASSGDGRIDEAFRAVMLAICGPDARPRDERRRNPAPEIRVGDIESLDDLNERINVLNGWFAQIKAARSAALKLPTEDARVAALEAVKRESDQHRLCVYELERLRKRFNADKAKKRASKQKDARRLTRYFRDAELLGEYWVRPQELFARAWESYVEDALVARGWLSTYLVTGTNVRYGVGRTGPDGETVVCEVYPHGDERLAINAAMGRLAALLAGR